MNSKQEAQQKVQKMFEEQIKARGKTKYEIADMVALISAEIVTGKGKWSGLDTETRTITALESTMLFSELLSRLFKEDK